MISYPLAAAGVVLLAVGIGIPATLPNPAFIDYALGGMVAFVGFLFVFASKVA